MTELPSWRCHKIVQAAKITEVIVRSADNTEITLLLDGDIEVSISDELRKRLPAIGAAGGYYVRYPDGYESWSPAKAFEEGYSRMPAPGTRVCAACATHLNPKCEYCGGSGRVPA